MFETNDRPSQPPIQHAIFLLLMTFLVYAQTVTFPFLGFDDIPDIVQNPSAHQFAPIRTYFATSANEDFALKAGRLPNLYRPLQSLWVVLNFKLFGLHPALWRLMSFGVYVLGVWLFWRVAWKLAGDSFIALAAALLYALHPLHVEGVAWISGACVEPLVTLFFFAGFLAYLRWREGIHPLWLGVYGILVFLALLWKESAAALPLVVIIHMLLCRTEAAAPASRKKGLISLVVTTACAVSVYAFMRIHAIHGVVAPNPQHSWVDALRTAPLVFVTYMKHALWPVSLSPWYDTQIVTHLDWTNFYLPLALCTAYAVMTVWAVIRKPFIGLLLLWWVVALAPALLGVLGLPDSMIVQDRLAFVALSPLCLLVASAAHQLPAWGRSLFGFKAASAIAMAILVPLLGILTAMQVNTWKSDMVLWTHAIEVSPASKRPRFDMAAELVRNRDFDRALPIYREMVTRYPGQWDFTFSYAMALLYSGHQTEAMPVLVRSIQVGPRMTPAYLVLADLLSREGKFDEAVNVLQQGIPVAREPELLRRQMTYVEARRRQAEHR